MVIARVVLVSLCFLLSITVASAKVSELALAKKNAVVTIYVEEKKKVTSIGSGFIVYAEGIIVTNYHVIEPWEKSTNGVLYVKASNGNFLEPTQVIASDKARDVALIQVKEKDLPFIRMALEYKPAQGDDIVVIGSPLGLETTVSDGIISSIRGDDGFLQITAPISSGSSGSPVLNSKGEAIGVATLLMTGGQNLNFAIPVSYVNSIAGEPVQQQKGLSKAAPEASQASGPGHRGKVLFTTDSGGYSYIRYEENGKESWVAAMQTPVKVGDIIEFPDSPPLLNFSSKSLEMTFDRLIFAPGIAVVSNTDLAFATDKEVRQYAESLKTGDPQEAMDTIDEAIGVRPDNARLYFLRAEAHYTSVRYFAEDGQEAAIKEKNSSHCNAALADLNRAIELDGKTDYFYSKRAEIISETNGCTFGNKVEALKDYDIAIQLNPKESGYHVSKGWIYQELGNHDKMLECAKKAAAVSPDGDSTNYLFGAYYKNVGNLPKALTYYKKALLADKGEYAIGTLIVDEIFSNGNRYSDAINFYSELISARPKDINFLIARSNFYEKQKNYSKAIADYNKMIEANPNEHNYAQRARLHYLNGEKAASLEDLNKACEMGNNKACGLAHEVQKEVNRGDKWEYLAASDGTGFFYDKTSLMTGKNGIKKVWVRQEIDDKENYVKSLELTEYEAKKYQGVSHTISRFEVKCQEHQMRMLSSITYTDRGAVIDSFTDEQASFGEIIPESIGASVETRVCGNKERRASKKK